VEWIHLAQDRDHWQALVNAVMNLWVLAPQSLSSLVSYDIINMYLYYILLRHSVWTVYD
jgi:hypothetical protein